MNTSETLLYKNSAKGLKGTQKRGTCTKTMNCLISTNKLIIKVNASLNKEHQKMHFLVNILPFASINLFLFMKTHYGMLRCSNFRIYKTPTHSWHTFMYIHMCIKSRL